MILAKESLLCFMVLQKQVRAIIIYSSGFWIIDVLKVKQIVDLSLLNFNISTFLKGVEKH